LIARPHSAAGPIVRPSETGHNGENEMAMPIQRFETATIGGWPCITHDGKAWRFGAAYQNLSTAKLADKLNAIVDKINDINTEWVMVETNSGTFGAEEACRVQGNGDPVRSTYYIDEQVG